MRKIHLSISNNLNKSLNKVKFSITLTKQIQKQNLLKIRLTIYQNKDKQMREKIKQKYYINRV